MTPWTIRLYGRGLRTVVGIAVDAVTTQQVLSVVDGADRVGTNDMMLAYRSTRVACGTAVDRPSESQIAWSWPRRRAVVAARVLRGFTIAKAIDLRLGK